jgi:hypothetical protein
MLAITHKTHIDTVLGYRQRYLQVRNRVKRRNWHLVECHVTCGADVVRRAA